ncbi:MAG: hypothetical protein ACXV4A_10145 [Actinomycetes bacterium]
MTLTVASLALTTACAAYALTRTPVGPALGLHPAPPCTVSAGDVTRRWSQEQAMNATTVAAVGQRLEESDAAVAAAVAVATRGRGRRLLDAAAARAVYGGPRQRASATSRAVAGALLGRNGAALTCTVPSAGRDAALDGEAPGPSGLTPRADTVRVAMRESFAKQILGGFAPEGVSSGHIEGSAHYEGRAIDVFFRPINPANTQRGWLQAQWAVAHAARLHVATVIFDRQIWTATRSASGWRPYVHPDGPTDNPVLLHEDHVHVDVLEGSRTLEVSRRPLPAS